MTLFQIDPFSLIPGNLRTAMRDALVDFVSDQAKKHLGDEVSNKLKKLRSDAAFNKKFEEGLRRAIKRFIDEYEAQDEDLAAAIAARPDFFQNEEVQKALLAVLKQPGASLADEQDKLAQSFQSVLPERKNRERVNKAVMYLLKCLAEELWHLPELQPIYSLQFQRMTAEATRQQVELQKAQLMALTDLSAGIREALFQLTNAIAEQKLLSSGNVLALPNRSQVLNNLPQPDYRQFVGREDEISKIYQVLRPYPYSQEHLITIDGIGGIGKSALALEVASRYLRNYDRIPDEERFDAIIWTSAKQSILSADGIKSRSFALRNLGDIFTAIAMTLQREDITRSGIDNQIEVVRNALKRQRTLLIVDNLETVDDENVITFLRELPAPTKAIVTTRHRIDVAYPVRVVGMAWSDAEHLIRHECTQKNVNLSEDEIRRLYSQTGGVPLALVWSISQISFGYQPSTVLKRLSHPTGDITRFCFDAGMKQIDGKPAQHLLYALSLFAVDASRDALGFVADLSELDRDDGLVQLETLSLVNRYSDRFSMLPITKGFVRSVLGSTDLLYKQHQERWFQYYQREGELWKNESSQSYLDELTNYKDVLDWCVLQGRLKKYIEMVLAIVWPLWVTGAWSEWQTYMQRGYEFALQLKDEYGMARFKEGFGVQAFFVGNFDIAISNLRFAQDIYMRSNKWIRFVSATTFLGQAYTGNNLYDEAEVAFSQALVKATDVTESDGDTRLIARVKRHYAELRIKQKQYGEAEKLLQEARSLIDERRGSNSLGMGIAFRLFACLYNETQQYQLALEYGLKALEIAETLGYKFDIAMAKTVLLDTYIALNRTDIVEQLALETKTLLESAGMVENAHRIDQLMLKVQG